MRRYLSSWQILLVLFFNMAISSPAKAFDENTIKVAFIEKLSHFVEWPAESSTTEITTNTDQSFTICVLGKSTLVEALNELAINSRIKSKPLKIHYLKKTNEINGCQSLFISSTSHSTLSEALTRINTDPILTISDTEGYAELGVMINFYIENGHLRFEINVGAANAAGIKIGARILKLARIVNNSLL